MDLVLTGRQAGDWDSAQVGLILGEMLGLPCISLAREIKMENGNVLVKKNIPGGYEQVRTRMPALVTVSNEVGELRYISRTKMMKMQEELAGRTVEGTAGGGMIKAVANGKQQIVSISIEKEVVDPEDVEMLQDLVLAAVNDALNRSQEMVSGEMSKLTGGMNIPGLV